MPLQLTIEIMNPRLSTHESLRVVCKLRNTGSVPATVPGPWDTSGAYQLLLYDPKQARVLRRMSRLTEQLMMTSARADHRVDVDTLAPGQEWTWSLDLAGMHYLLPPGEYRLDAILDYPDAGTVRSNAQPLVVTADPLASVLVMRDNPIIDSFTLLLEADTPGGTAFFLRQHNSERPVGAWYATRALDGDGVEAPFLLSAGFYQAEEIDPAYQKWLVWTARGQVQARQFQDGRPGATISAEIPEGLDLVRSGFYTRQQELFLFFWSREGPLECHRLENGRLVRLFRHVMRVPAGTPLAIGAFNESIHLAAPWRGVLYDSLSVGGASRHRWHVYRSRLPVRSMEYDAAGRRFKFLFVEAGHGGAVQMAVADLANDRVSTYALDRPAVHEAVREWSFDQDARGRFHWMMSTESGRLFYFSEERGPVLVARDEGPYYPVVAAPLQVYLGFYRRTIGYRFVQYRRRHHGSKLIGTEAHF